MVFNLFASLAEFERELIRERTQAGLSAARARGRVGGRPKGLSSQAEATAMAAETLYRERRLSVSAIAGRLHISKSTLYGYLRHRGVEVGPYNKPAQARPDSPADANGESRTATVLLWLRGREQQQVRARQEARHRRPRSLSAPSVRRQTPPVRPVPTAGPISHG